MAQTAINKPIYDAFKDAGASEEKSTLAARAVLPSVDEASTKGDVERAEAALKSHIERVEAALKSKIERVEAHIERVEASLRAEIERVEASLTAKIEQVEATLRAEMSSMEARLTWRLLGGVAIIQGLALAFLKFV